VMRTRGGEVLRLEAVRNIYRIGSREVAQYNYRDMTQRRKLEEQLREAQKMESIGQLAGGLAHDFNNILNVISVYAAIVRRDADGAKFAQPVGVIEKAIDRGAGVVHQLLTFARKTEMEFRQIDVNATVTEVLELIAQTFPPTVKLQQEIEAELPLVMADANQIHQALLNLCVNSRDAMPEGGVLTIRTSSWPGSEVRQRHAEADSESYIVVEVSDTGHGMDDETRARVFEPFFTTKGPSGGSGLGLPVVYGIVRNHRGFVDVESKPGAGTTVRLSFPIRGGGPDGR
jgi:two-component system cell cycle sensor histidine kinase/response regulator CckA